MTYTNDSDSSRITNSIGNLDKIINYVHDKHKDCLNKTITVTTVILSYNQENTIHQCIESALSQKGNFKHNIIIIDDCSTDQTFKIISKYKNFENVIIYENQNNIG